MAIPAGPACHRNTATCFDGDEDTVPELAFLAQLETLIAKRDEERPEGSYTTQLFKSGIKRISQKVGEEGVETALAAVSGDLEEIRNESADLLYHLLVLLRASGVSLAEVNQVLRDRHFKAHN
jgi:phosphoribosyl-ATP pyrophosphohydrolase/phosphoribosyl-AMP cyclohydrolase